MTRKSLILFGFIFLKFLLQYFLINPEYDLQRDEYLHLDQGNHLAWGYLSVPPVTSWISLLIRLLGNTVFWVKFFPALFGALTIAVVWKTTEELKGNLFAQILAATCVLLSVLLRINLLYQPNSLDILCWTTFYFILIKYINTGEQKWLLAGAFVFAIGFLNKYNIIFLLIGLFPVLLLTRQRRMFATKGFYAAMLLLTLLILPNLLWQYKNDFSVFHHLKELSETQLTHVDRLDFLKGQLLFFIGSIVVIVSGLYALLFDPAFKEYRVFFWSILFTLCVFIYFKAKDYYAIGIYPVYIAFGSAFLATHLKAGWKKYLQPLLICIPLLFFIPMYKLVFPNRAPEEFVQEAEKYRQLGLLRWEDGRDHALQQDFADMLGWKQLAEKTDSIYTQLPDPDQTLIVCDNYGEAGAINFYTKNKEMKASSLSADYINWFTFDKTVKNVLLIKEDAKDEDRSRKKEIPFFDTVYFAGKRINPYAREQEISIYVLKGAKVDINQVIRKKIEKEKSSW